MNNFFVINGFTGKTITTSLLFTISSRSCYGNRRELDIPRLTDDRRRNRAYAAHELANALYSELDVVLAEAGRAGRLEE